VIPEIMPPALLVVPPLMIRKKSEVPWSVNVDDVVVLNLEPNLKLLPSWTKPSGPGSVRVNEKLEERRRSVASSGQADLKLRTWRGLSTHHRAQYERGELYRAVKFNC
jgi:hypothetical protein